MARARVVHFRAHQYRGAIILHKVFADESHEVWVMGYGFCLRVGTYDEARREIDALAGMVR